MEFNNWFRKRGVRFVLQRGSILLDRYGFGSTKACARVENAVETLAEYDCTPTLFVPAVVVRRHTSFIRSLQQKGCEIGVHGYNHVDLQAYPPADSAGQLLQAVEVFKAREVELHGFRCPYLSSSDALMSALPNDVFEYSSNTAVEWPYKRTSEETRSLMFDTITKFYNPVSADVILCLPWEVNGMVELPCCVPDDLQLHDGLGYDLEQIAQVWLDTLHQTYRRGEMFNLMFHPEMASFCEEPFTAVLKEARHFQPQIWVTRLCEIAAWQREFSNFSVDIDVRKDGYDLRFNCTPRATLLYRGFVPSGESSPWDGMYRRTQVQSVRVDGPRLPFIGLPADAPEWVTASLKRVGYILETGESGLVCSLYLDKLCLSQFTQPVELISYIESLRVPLLRFWPWPDGKRSVLTISGDLDALSLMDYATRLFVR